MDGYDYYGRARQLINMMRREDCEAAADELENAIAAGFTATEIFMALRWHIDTFLEAGPACSDVLLQSARELRKRIDAALA